MYPRMVGPGPNPSGLCRCGCGDKTPLAPRSRSHLGWIVGKPMPYLIGHNKRPSTPEYLEESRGQADPCWIWQRSINRGGYGLTTRDGKTGIAHRAYWEREHGPVPEGHDLHHVCGNRACVNPAHLRPVERGAHSSMHNRARRAA